MKSYTYPISYTEMCPYYPVTVVGTTCLSVDTSNRLSISKLNSKQSIIGKKIYLGWLASINRATLSTTILSINKNIININRKNIQIEPGGSNSSFGYYTAEYYSSFTDDRTYTNNQDSEKNITFNNTSPSLCYSHNIEGTIFGELNFTIETYVNGIIQNPNSITVIVQSTNINLTQKSTGKYEGTWNNLMRRFSNLDINYSINLTMPPNQTSTISIVLIIDKIELFEYICQTTSIPLKQGTHLQLIPGLGPFYMMIDDFLYDD